MSNVKPGDFAKFIAPHRHAGNCVHVVGEPGAEDFAVLQRTRDYRPSMVFWRVKILFSGQCNLFTRHGEWVKGRSDPGEIVIAADEMLRRIDPDSEPETEERKEPIHVGAW